MSRKKIQVSVYVDEEQYALGKRISAATRVPLSVYMRDAFDAVIADYSHVLEDDDEDDLEEDEDPDSGDHEPADFSDYPEGLRPLRRHELDFDKPRKGFTAAFPRRDLNGKVDY